MSNHALYTLERTLSRLPVGTLNAKANKYSSSLRRYEISKSFSRESKHTPSSGFQPSPIYDLEVGQRVEHAIFGFGTIISLDGNDANAKAIVKFDDSGEKTLLLKFAKLRIV